MLALQKEFLCQKTWPQMLHTQTRTKKLSDVIEIKYRENYFFSMFSNKLHEGHQMEMRYPN